MEYHQVDQVLGKIKMNGIDIDVKLLHQAEVLHLKLDKELDIKEFIQSVVHVDDYKTILKSVKTLNDKVQNAQNLGVDLDQGLQMEVNKCTSRLISERNLRHEMEKAIVSTSMKENVDNLKLLIERATENGVEQDYQERAEKLQEKMTGNIKAREIL